MEHVVLEYDLRHARGPILSSPSRDLSEVLQNQDEVNQIAAMYYTKPKQKTTKGGGGKGTSHMRRGGSEESLLYLAAADDDGTIRFMESTSTQSHILHHDPNGVAVVPCCAFRPGSSKTLDLVSGGTDCKIHLWDPFKPK
jgi:WD40 repeat protein